MTRFVDKALFIVMGIVMVATSESAIMAVTSMLLGVIAAALGSCVTDLRYRAAYMALFVAGCFFIPELRCFLPVIFYDCAMERHTWLIYLVAPVFFLYDKGQGISLQKEVLWLTFLAIAAVLGYRTGNNERLEREMISLRDSSTELNLVLREKNKNLLEKQDYEIYLATLRERNRIAREIHDNVGHMLSRSILQIGALTTIHKEEPLHEQLTSVNDTLGQAMNSIRESVHDLHDEAIDLRQAILEATREMAKEYELTIDYDMSAEVPRNVKYCFIATVKEAMSNIVKHSNADKILVILREHPGFYQLTVEDNGTAAQGGRVRWETIQGEEVFGGGIGLANMRERVEALRGTFRVHCEKGFQIFISIPKEQKNESFSSR